MRKHRFFLEQQNIKAGDIVTMSPFDSNHIKSVLRLKKGDDIYIFNGEKEFSAKLVLVSSKGTTAKIEKLIKSASKESEKKLTVYLSLIKNPNFELALEKLSELGVDRIIPLETEFTQISAEKLSKKYERWKKIVVAASKQSGRISVPQIEVAAKLKNVLPNVTSHHDLVLVLSTDKKRNYKNLLDLDLKHKNDIAIIIGPEGGFSNLEESLFDKLNLNRININPNILRTETAAIISVGVVKFMVF